MSVRERLETKAIGNTLHAEISIELQIKSFEYFIYIDAQKYIFLNIAPIGCRDFQAVSLATLIIILPLPT